MADREEQASSSQQISRLSKIMSRKKGGEDEGGDEDDSTGIAFIWLPKIMSRKKGSVYLFADGRQTISAYRFCHCFAVSAVCCLMSTTDYANFFHRR